MECPNCREIENGEWRYYVSRSPDHELYLSEDEMDYENSPIEFLDMVQSLPRMIIMDENGKQGRRGFVRWVPPLPDQPQERSMP
ncbi:uncharacterized protein [Malus domestica]|uniref:uncharacterized protein isoform X4 n=1 Tax=Malus domestica TaxID=3750 RepID=UPI00397489EF